MAFISIVIVAFAIIYAIYKYKSIDDFPKKWRKFKFEMRMTWIGFANSWSDLFYRSVDKVDLFPQPHKVAVMTGGSRGIGLASLKKLLECKMTVMLGVRNPENCQEIVEKALDESLFKGKIYYAKCDTGDMESVREFSLKVQERFPGIHLLINNAGILTAPYVITKDGFVSQMAVNYVGHFYLSHLLMPQLIAGSSEGENSRIVNVASCVHQVGKIRFDDFNYSNYYRAGIVYADSKLAQIMFTKHLTKVCQEKGWKVQVHAAHPGVVKTDIFNKSIMGQLSNYPISRHWFKTPERGSRTVITAAISPKLESKSGSYIVNCQAVETYESANNPEEGKRLFDYTCDLLKIKSFGQCNKIDIL